MLKAGFAEVDITPTGVVHLLGYFTERLSDEALDPLFAKAAVLDDGHSTAAILVLDSAAVVKDDAQTIRHAICSDPGLSIDEVLITATHTHTAPSPVELFPTGLDREYVDRILIPGAIRAITSACKNVAEVSIEMGEAAEQELAFTRRHFMADGSVKTNPRKGDPHIVKPEREPYHTVRVYSFRSSERLTGLLVLAANHCDTIGGNKVSADWPGQMANALKDHFGNDVPVIFLCGCSGDVNHFDPTNPDPQTSYDEAIRIGTGYARFALEALKNTRPVAAENVSVVKRTVRIPRRSITQEEIWRAKQILNNSSRTVTAQLKSEDLAIGNPAVEAFYADQLLGLSESSKGKDAEDVAIACLAVDKHAFAFLPGEVFTDIGEQIRTESPFEITSTIELFEHFWGYIPLKKHFERGGYEPRSTRYNCLAQNAGKLLIQNVGELLKQLQGD